MSNFENRIKQNYTFKGKMQGTFPLEQYFTPITYSVSSPLDKIDTIFCNIFHIKGGELSIEAFAELLGFSIVDNPKQKKYKDVGETSIFNSLLENLKLYNLIYEKKDLIETEEENEILSNDEKKTESQL